MASTVETLLNSKSHLSITIPESIRGRMFYPSSLFRVFPCIMRNVENHDPPDIQSDFIQVTAIALLCSSEHSNVVRARILDSDQTVVLKFCTVRNHMFDFDDEVENYQTVFKDVQGTLVPRFYGYYKAGVRKKLTGCIMMEDCGQSIRKEFTSLAKEERIKILRSLAELHKTGCHLPDLRERNVVVKDGQYRFIDLEEVSEHKCHFRGDFIPDVNRPPWFTFGCKILFQLAVKMEIWNDIESASHAIEIFAFYCQNDHQKFPSQEVADFLIDSQEPIDIAPSNRKKIIEWLMEAQRQGVTEETMEEFSKTGPVLENFSPEEAERLWEIGWGDFVDYCMKLFYGLDDLGNYTRILKDECNLADPGSFGRLRVYYPCEEGV